jgi:hypothetical protein
VYISAVLDVTLSSAALSVNLDRRHLGIASSLIHAGQEESEYDEEYTIFTYIRQCVQFGDSLITTAAKARLRK